MVLIKSAVAVLALLGGVYSRTFYVKNKCSYTVWPAIFTPGNSPVKPNAPTGWEAPPNSLWRFTVPNGWTSGRIWGRRDCNFSQNPGPGSCSTGGCNGGLKCDPSSGTGVPPATLAEWTLNGWAGLDYYDVSLVDGFNIPMSILTNKGCPTSDCTNDIGKTCPSELKRGDDGCLSACAANLDGNPKNSPNCCTGQYDQPGTCPSSGIKYYSHFKQGCPNSYIYAYDEGSSTALRNCSASRNSDFLLTFCP
ncbi:Osmotin, thaumatin-like protein [Fomitiporia mediterranea MF3/22]|uniref:Osmotin, thaumatin-like protein n=1 Tax=Fomitiporia mediterranea (strain MF3/22) TaxID=694068 RepID=UPI00044082AC|nr:Osmotin, thaumatin-like protein [Fomitiporia mediterranea MF3/22]EJD06262.1 Osmotin, thaumatin-like protein [Fomitiporia mediterranea MF3/22]